MSFQISGGTVTGRDHVREWKNNQDAFEIIQTPDLGVVVLCDGCSEGKHSEVGAKIGAQLISRAILRHFSRTPSSFPTSFPTSFMRAPRFLEAIQREVVARIHTYALDLGDSLSTVVHDYFLFTTVGMVTTPTVTFFFYLGDGLVVVNDVIYPIGPFPSNEPPYLGYSVLGRTHLGDAPIQFQVLKTIPTDELSSFILATDGGLDFVRAAGSNIPGKAESLGTIDQFLTDRHFTNPAAVTLRLRLANRSGQKIDPDTRRPVSYHGLLPDDTTIVVGRWQSDRET